MVMTEKTKKILAIVGYVICAVQLIMGIVFIAHLFKLDLIVTKAVVLIAVIIAGSAVIFAVLQKYPIPGIVTKLISIALCVAMVFGISYVKATDKTLDKILSTKTQIENYSVYVLSSDKAEKLENIKDYKVGTYANEQDKSDMTQVVDKINTEINSKIDAAAYDDITELVKDLYDKKIQAIIVNGTHISMMAGTDEYATLEQDVKAIWNMGIEKEVEIETDPSDKKDDDEKDPYEEYKDYMYSGDDVFTIYVSGIDTTGPANVVRNSDVNILVTVNMKTRQILMINTPRDYYIPLSISNGVKDKLTHAGCYGVRCSIDTMQMLYNIKIDNYVKINFSGFVGIIDAIGGIDVYSEYEFTVDPIKTYTVGMNHCTGIEALAFARERHSFAAGDRQRGKNQMEVIKAVINKLASTDTLLNYKSFLEELALCIVTDMDREQLSDLIKFQLSDMRGWDVITYSVDGTGDSQIPYSLSFATYVMNPDMNTVAVAKDYLAKILNGEVIQ